MSQGRALAELRRSNASGPHGKRSSDRYNNNRKILEWEATMSVLDDISQKPRTGDDEVAVIYDPSAANLDRFGDQAYVSCADDDGYDPDC